MITNKVARQEIAVALQQTVFEILSKQFSSLKQEKVLELGNGELTIPRLIYPLPSFNGEIRIIFMQCRNDSDD